MPDESPEDRHNRELIELLNGLRVALPGVQMLFGFLLVVPFSQRFDQLSALDRGVYFTSLLSAAGSSAMFIAPSAYHRVEFRLQDKEHIVEMANRFALAGFAFLGLGMTGAILLVTNFLFSTETAVIATVIAASMFVTFRYALPFRRRRYVSRRSRG